MGRTDSEGRSTSRADGSLGEARQRLVRGEKSKRGKRGEMNRKGESKRSGEKE